MTPSPIRRAAALIGAAIATATMSPASIAHANSSCSGNSQCSTQNLTPTSGGSGATGVTLGTSISRAMVIARAKVWSTEAVPYTGTAAVKDQYGNIIQKSNWDNSPWAFWTDSQTGGPFRQDCSGLVNMAWGLKDNPNGNGIAASYADRLNDANGNPDPSQLQPGDILISTGHVVIFNGWAASDHSKYYAIEETPPNVIGGDGSDVIPYPYWTDSSGHINGAGSTYGGTYWPYRYKNISDAPPKPPNPAVMNTIGTWNSAQPVSSTNPNNNSPQTVSGQIMLTSTETTASRVWYYLDDTNPAANNGVGLIADSDSGGKASPAHNLPFDTTKLSNSTHTITAAAFDSVNPSVIDSTKTLTVNVNNTPPVSHTSPSLAALPNGDYDVAWSSAGGSPQLWLGTGTGTNMWSYGNPYQMGVAPGTHASIITQTDGSWVAAWSSAGSSPQLWLATGVGNVMTSYSNPYQMGVASGTSPSLVALAGGGWEVAWSSAGSSPQLWLATGSGTTMTGYGNPYQMGVAAGTSPSLAALPNGGWEVAWASAGSSPQLWLATGSGTTMTGYGNPYQMGVAAGSSPSLTARPDNSWVVAWHGSDTNNPNGSLWIASGSGTTMTAYSEPYQMGVLAGTNPSIVTLATGGWEVAWTGAGSNPELWLATGSGTTMTGYGNPYQMGVQAGTSPSLAALPNGDYDVAWSSAGSNPELWLGTGTGTNMWSYGNPYQMGIA